jgi:hypothetical protein
MEVVREGLSKELILDGWKGAVLKKKILVRIIPGLPSAVAHIFNSSYSGGGNPEDCGSRPAWAKVFKTPSQKTELA